MLCLGLALTAGGCGSVGGFFGERTVDVRAFCSTVNVEQARILAHYATPADFGTDDAFATLMERLPHAAKFRALSPYVHRLAATTVRGKGFNAALERLAKTVDWLVKRPNDAVVLRSLQLLAAGSVEGVDSFAQRKCGEPAIGMDGFLR